MSGRPTTRVRFKGRFTSGWAFHYRRPRSARPASEQTVHVPGKRILAPGKGSGCSATPILPPPPPQAGKSATKHLKLKLAVALAVNGMRAKDCIGDCKAWSYSL